MLVATHYIHTLLKLKAKIHEKIKKPNNYILPLQNGGKYNFHFASF